MTSGSKLSLFWQSYKYRFVPWLALNFRNRTSRRVDGGRQDKVVPDEEALRQVTALTRALVAALSRPLGAPHQHPQLMRNHDPQGRQDIGVGSSKASLVKTASDESDWREQLSPAPTKSPLADGARKDFTTAPSLRVEEAPDARQLNNVSYSERLRAKSTTKGVEEAPHPVPPPLGKDVDPYDLCLVPPRPSISIHETAQQVLEATQGFRVECCPSTVGGTGVRVTDVIDREVLPPGLVVGIYPGTLYLPQQQAVMLQSLANSFLFRCFDGLLLDGSNRGLSKMIFRSCAGRDRVGPCPTADTSWITVHPSNPLSVGQFVNNRSKSNPSNVAYQEVTVQPGTFSLPERAYLPILWYSPPPHTPLLDVPFRLVVLVTTRDVAAGEELFSEYFTIITDSPNSPVP